MELQAKDLRIGNYISVTDEEYGIIKDSIEECNYHHIKDLETDNQKYSYKPIPLTEEWLLRFGFEKWTWCDDCAFIPLFFGDSLYCRYYHNEWHIKRIKVGRDSKGVYGKSEGKYVLPRGKIKYVHQLQNLYFALTNEELTIKETVK